MSRTAETMDHVVSEGMVLAIEVGVSQPRHYLPGATYLVTRRCVMRKFLLTPSAMTTQIIEYCLAVAAERTGVLVHAAVGMGNHLHDVVTDPEGRMGEFLWWFHQHVAAAVNVTLDRDGMLFDGREPNVVALGDDGAIIDRIIYCAVNPVEAGLVSHGEMWPGVRRYRPGSRRVRKPGVYFDSDNDDLPAIATLKIVPPPVWTMTVGQALEEIESGVAAAEERIRAELSAAGRRFVGARAVLEQDVYGEPNTPSRRTALVPRVAARDRSVRRAMLEALHRFWHDYGRELAVWRTGDRSVLFPAGTYLMRILHSAPCADT